MDSFWFNGWDPLARILIIGPISYFALLIMLRIAGKRTLARMTSYDFIISMALGSMIAKILLTKDTSLSESLLAMALLIGLQWLVSKSVCCNSRLRHLIAAEPTVLYKDGEFITRAMLREHVAREELVSVVHEKGIRGLEDVEAIILNSNGQISVIPKPSKPEVAPASLLG